MKRAILFLMTVVMIIILFSAIAAADEITFSSIPWGSDPFAVERELDKIGLLVVSSVDCPMMLYDSRVENTDQESGQWGGPVTEKICGFIASGMDVLDSRDQFFEGLTVNSVSGYCVYGLKDNNPQRFAI